MQTRRDLMRSSEEGEPNRVWERMSGTILVFSVIVLRVVVQLVEVIGKRKSVENRTGERALLH